jgi:DNA-binding NarL/FixJ family response regulator
MRGDIRAPSAVSACSSANVSRVGQSAQETYWKISGPFENVPSGFCPAIPTLLGDRAGGVGYLLKHRVTDVGGFCDDLSRVARGGVVLDPEGVAVMVGRSARDDGRVDRLTPRQLQVLGLLAEGRSNLAIANRLTITEKAVARHAAQIYDTLGLPPSLDDHRRVLAVVRFLDR